MSAGSRRQGLARAVAGVVATAVGRPAQSQAFDATRASRAARTARTALRLGPMRLLRGGQAAQAHGAGLANDRTRNRGNAQRARLARSKAADCYGEDFRLGHRGIAPLPALATRHAEVLADAPADRERIRSGVVDFAFIDDDRALNDAP